MRAYRVYWADGSFTFQFAESADLALSLVAAVLPRFGFPVRAVYALKGSVV